MEREQLISKWLDNELSEAELQAFKSLEDYDDLVRIAETTKQLEPPVYHTPGEYKRLRKTLDTNKKSVIIYLKPLLKIAAVLLLFASIYYATTSTQKTVNLQTDIAQKEVITLPDNSVVTVNAMTTLYYDPTTWDDNRAVTLDGEAYFQVAKGATFSVETPNGLVSVLGTQFNVRNRDDKFEVYCYEGSVQVETATKTVILKPGDRFRESVKISSNTPQSTTLQPSWVRDETSFEKTPLKEVLKEFERHYDVSVTVDKEVENVLFTGSFTHTNMKIALKSISLPFNLSHKKQGNKVTLSRD